MINYNFSQIVPVNLIQKPVEQAVIAIWLIAIGQFVNFAFTNSDSITIGWFLTAPVLMFASLIVAVRTKNSMPFIIVFFTGLSVVIVLCSPELALNLFINKGENKNLYSYFSKILMIASLYGLLFWLLFTRFLNSCYFLSIENYIASGNKCCDMTKPLDKISFYLSFLMINISLVIYIAIGFIFPDDINLNVFFVAIIFLFVSGRFVSENIRGILLPVYMTFFLIVYFNIPGSSTNIDLLVVNNVLLVWSFMLWGYHNIISTTYNCIFKNKKIITVLWPWYGLLSVLFVTFIQAAGSFVNEYSLLILIIYLLLMLRNTSLPLISWSIVFLSVWQFLMLLNTENLSGIGLVLFLDSGQACLFFCLSLLVFSVFWERNINPLLMYAGWQKIAFSKPIIFIVFTISLFYLIVNSIIAFSLLADAYDLININLKIENTSVLVLLLFFSLSLFINNKTVANLIYFSTFVLLVISWSDNQVFPVYLLFALINFTLVLLPLVVNRLNKDESYWGVIINESITWVYISFAASLISLFCAMGMSDFDFETTSLFFNVGILFIASIILVKYHTGKLWHIISYILAAALIVSIRLMIMGTVAVNEIDTIGIFVISFFFYSVNYESPLSLNRIHAHCLGTLLPLGSLLTIPWSTGSLHSSLTLFILGIFYFAIQNSDSKDYDSKTHGSNKMRRIMQYSAFGFINMSIYLWIPVLSDYSGLLLFYVIPVAFSLLFVTHLHKNEIKPELQNKVRLLALSSLYVVITADVFINETLFIFVLGLLSGLASIIYGISSKIRLFLYTGISFMVVIVFGQLMMFYPEGRLARALILMVLGTAITGTMILFNIKREMLLSKIKMFRTDLDTWD